MAFLHSLPGAAGTGARLATIPRADAGTGSTADVLGTAFDSTEAVLVGVKVTITNLSTGFVRTAVGNESGNFLLPALPVGHYSVKAETTGFKSYSVADVALAEGDRRKIDLHMEVGQVTESVNVAAQTRRPGASAVTAAMHRVKLLPMLDEL